MSALIFALSLATAAPLPAAVQAASLFRAARISYEAGDPARALPLFQASYRLLPAPALLVNVAHCLKRLGRVDEAARTYRQFLDSRWGDRRVRVEVFEALDELSAPVGPIAAPSPELRARAEPFFRRGRARYEAGDLEGALADLRAAYAAFPSPPLLVNLAQCLRRLDRLDEAVLAYRAFLESPGASRAVRMEVWEALDETVSALETRLYRLADSAVRLQQALDGGLVEAPLRARVSLTVHEVRRLMLDMDPLVGAALY